MGGIIRITALLAAAAFIAGCTGGIGKTGVKNSPQINEIKAQGGGTNYDGKIYVNLEKEMPCPDGSRVRSQIEVSAQTATVVRENCSIITPKNITLTDMDLLPHNLQNGLFGGRVFDLEPRDQTSTQWLCRGKYKNGRTNEMQVADVIIKHTGTNPIADSARAIMAVYEPTGALAKVLDSSELKLRQISTEVAGRVKYVTAINGRFGITLWIDINGYPKTGKLALIELPYEGRQFETGYNYRDYERVIQNLTCYTH